MTRDTQSESKLTNCYRDVSTITECIIQSAISLGHWRNIRREKFSIENFLNFIADGFKFWFGGALREGCLDLFNLWTGGNKVLERTFWIKFLFIDFDRKPWQNRKEFLKKEFSYVVEWKKKKAEKEGKYFCETSKLFFRSWFVLLGENVSPRVTENMAEKIRARMKRETRWDRSRTLCRSEFSSLLVSSLR